MHHCACMLSHFSHVRFFVTPWTVAHQAPLSIGFSRQEYWSGLPCPALGDLPDPGIQPTSLMPLALIGDYAPLRPFLFRKKTLLLAKPQPSICCLYYGVSGSLSVSSYHKNAPFRTHYPFTPRSHLHCCMHLLKGQTVYMELTPCPLQLVSSRAFPCMLCTKTSPKSFKKAIMGHDPVSIS